jgi:hypothetical protein
MFLPLLELLVTLIKLEALINYSNQDQIDEAKQKGKEGRIKLEQEHEEK